MLLVAVSCTESNSIEQPVIPTAVFDSAYVTKTDNSRNRTLPLKIYFPKNSTAKPYPVILFSHGGTGSEASMEAYRYFGTYMASNGYVCIHPNQEKTNAKLSEDKPLDMSFILDLIQQNQLPVPGFAGSFDMTKVGAAGHSFGGYATIALSGSKMYEGNTIVTYTDSRIKSFVVLSPSGKDQYGLYINATDNSWNQINKPVYCILGEYEIETDGGGNYQEPGWRLQAYNYMPAGDKYQSVLPKVLHHHFNDRGTPALGEEAIEESTQRFVKQNALHFFNYYLSNNGDINLLGTLGNVTGVTNSKK